MKKNWTKFVKNLKGLSQCNANMPNEMFVENESKDKTKDSLFLTQGEKILSSDNNRKSFLQFCNQTYVLSIDDVFNQELYRDLVRFDYGSYAELFSGFDNKTNELVVLKLIRAVSSDLKNRLKGTESGTKFIAFEEIHNEFQICEALSNLSDNESNETNCFPKVFDKYLVSGDIPEYILKGETTEELPSFKDDIFEDWVYMPREYAIIVMPYGGQPLWKALRERSITPTQLVSVVQQLTIGLAVAEEELEFEHRDLHISNILIKETTKQKIHFIHNFKRYCVDSEGFEATIIDTTFSRIRIGNRIHSKNLTNIMKFDDNSCLSSQDKCYKSMVSLTNNDWNKFTPKSNINWLLYISKILLKSDIIKESDDKQSKDCLKDLIQLFKAKQTLQEIDFNLISKKMI